VPALFVLETTVELRKSTSVLVTVIVRVVLETRLTIKITVWAVNVAVIATGCQSTNAEAKKLREQFAGQPVIALVPVESGLTAARDV